MIDAKTTSILSLFSKWAAVRLQNNYKTSLHRDTSEKSMKILYKIHVNGYFPNKIELIWTLRLKHTKVDRKMLRIASRQVQCPYMKHQRACVDVIHWCAARSNCALASSEAINQNLQMVRLSKFKHFKYLHHKLVTTDLVSNLLASDLSIHIYKFKWSCRHALSKIIV